MSEVKISSILSHSLIDKRINTKSWMTTMTIGNYLKMSNTKGNIYQRDLQRLSFYQKLIDDLLHDGLMPPISVVYTGKIEEIEQKKLNKESSFLILDGLQRTNCLQNCIERIETGEGIFKSLEEFLNKEIYVEIWENMSFENILYKMIVLNTGQKKMDYNHQLNILSESISNRLDGDGITYLLSNEKKSNMSDSKFYLSTITEGLASFINGSPLQSKKNAAEFLFNRFDGNHESNKLGLELISDEETYNILKWVITDLNKAMSIKYQENNPLIKYDVFFISLMAALGNVYNRNQKNGLTKRIDIDKKKEELLNLINSDSIDPLEISLFDSLYNSFKTGIGTRKRKFVFEAFKSYFIVPYSSNIDWGVAYDIVN